MKQIYHPYTKWECYKNGMWQHATKQDKIQILPLAIEFTGNHIEYGKAMGEVIKKWHYSCEHHLTDNGINQKAFIGHAACNFKWGWNEEIVRIAWGNLSDIQRQLANEQAQYFIDVWKQNHINKLTKNYGQLRLWD